MRATVPAAPGPLEPIVIDRVEAARQCKKELQERYPGTTFSVTTDRSWYPSMNIDWDDGPEREEVELIAREYVGYDDDGDDDPTGVTWRQTTCRTCM